MDPQTTRLVFFAIMGVGVVVWLFSLGKVLRIGRPATAAESDVLAPADDGQVDEYGEVTVNGEPTDVAKGFVRMLFQSHGGMVPSLYRVREDGDRVTLEKTGPLVANQPMSLYFSDADLRFDRGERGTVVVSYRLGFTRLARRMRRIALAIIFGIGLPVLVGVGLLIWYLVVNSPNPIVRGQVLQTLQIAHALWPPFLFTFFVNGGRRRSKMMIENMITSSAVQEAIGVR